MTTTTIERTDVTLTLTPEASRLIVLALQEFADVRASRPGSAPIVVFLLSLADEIGRQTDG